MKVSLVIPTVNQVNMVWDCIDTFRKYNGNECEIIVVEDGSPKEIQDQVRFGCTARKVRYFQNEVNSGFAKTVNVGIRNATGDIICLINNDLLFDQEIITPMVDAFKRDSDVGIVGALLKYPKAKTIQHGGIFRAGFGFGHRGHHQKLEDNPELLKGMYLIGVTGALFAMRREMLFGEKSIGLLNENYFLASEDVEMCLRAWLGGWRIFYEPKVVAYHKEGGTRGATDQEKMIKGRSWLIKERQTAQIFNQWLKTLNFKDLDSKVQAANFSLFSDILNKRNETSRELLSNFSHDKTHEKLMAGEKQIVNVRRAGALGDVLLTTAVVKKLKEDYPNIEIWFSTESPGILEGNPYISKIVRMHEHVPTDIVFNLDLAYENNPKMNVVDAYSLTVFNKVLEDRLPLMASGQTDAKTMAMKIRQVNFATDKVLVFHMTTSWENRTWPNNKWMEVIKHFSTKGYKIIIIGSGGDQRSQLYSNVYNFHNMLSLTEIRELMKLAKCFIGMDSGMLHIAQTTKTPIVGLFTVANPRFRIVRDEKTYPIYPASLDCVFCLHEMPPPVTFKACHKKNIECLQMISPQEVIVTIESALC